jgi:acyl transferase domain-containing protein/SAM-dependent methyltransferase
LSTVKRALLEIRELRERLTNLEEQRTEPIAIVGMGLRFPGGVADPESFWRMLCDGVDAIGEVPAERWNLSEYYDSDPDAPGKMSTRFGGFLSDVAGFDAAFFRISPREAMSTDPQQRMLLETAWEALEHGGIAPDRLFNSRTGVYVGIGNSDYFRMLMGDSASIDTYTTTGNALSIAAGRLSYTLGLRGPSLAVDTACSASLVAIHLAVQSLRNRECDLAIAGGVNLILTPELTINFSKAAMMAPDGRCKAFDAAADGYVRSEGCGIVALKRLSSALADKNIIYALVRGSAVNQDGRSSGLTAPNGPAQEAVIVEALADAGVTPSAVGYVEAHGTGTPLGDPIEMRAIGAALCRERSHEHPLQVGSVKTNLGHLEAAAGIAGLIKVALMLRHGQIPPHLHLSELNPHIAAEHLPMSIPAALVPWLGQGPRIGGVSSFGLSGTNAHVVLEQAPEPPAESPGAVRPRHLLPLSAKSEPAVRALAERYASYLAANPHASAADVCYTAGAGRAHFSHRVAIRGADAPALARGIEGFLYGRDNENVMSGDASNGPPEVVFLFTGHGSHYAGMGKRLYQTETAFRTALDRCADLLLPHLDRPLQDILFEERRDGVNHPLDRMDHAQPALFALQYALTEQWRSWGVLPAVVAGHSAGEYVAAVIAGVLSLEDGLNLIATRGRLMHALPPDGAMVAIFAAADVVARAVAPRAGEVGIAAVNGPETTVISGRRDAIEAVLCDLHLADDDLRRLDIPVAAHSPLVEPILDVFERAAGGVTLKPPQISLISSMTGAAIGSEITDARYWRRHLREPVRFADVFATLRAAGQNIFVEIGPQPTLLRLGQRCWPDDSGVWVPSLHRDVDDNDQMLASLGTLYVRGVDVNWDAIGESDSRRRLTLPTYPWQRERYWSPVASAASTLHASLDTRETWIKVTSAAREQAAQGPFDLVPASYPARWEALNRLAVAYIAQAVRELGLFLRPGERLNATDLEQLGIVPTYGALVQRWLGHLVRAGLLRQDADGAFTTGRPLVVPDIRELEREATVLLSDSPPLLEYVRRCGERLAAVLTGAESPLATLFPDGSYETVDYLYHTWPVARYFNAITRAVAATAASARSGRGRAFRAIEIGAGTGGTTAAVLTALPSRQTEYVFTDVSDFFRARAMERFAPYPFVRYGLLNIEKPVQEQGYAAQGFDLVIAANVLHATRDLDTALRHTLDLLMPGGLLVLYEVTDHPLWLDITTGLIEGWQRFGDRWRGGHPLLGAGRWAEALRENGFSDVTTLPGPGDPTAALGQHIVIARAGDRIAEGDRVADARPASVALGARPFAPADSTGSQLGEPESILDALTQALPAERRELLVDFARRAVARVLRAGDPGRLGRDQRLLDLGFDSLMAVELRNVLRQGLALEQKLPATLVFDHPTIAAIAGYLERVISPAPPAAAHPAPANDEISVDAAEIAAMTDEQVEKLLLKRLEGIRE